MISKGSVSVPSEPGLPHLRVEGRRRQVQSAKHTCRAPPSQSFLRSHLTVGLLTHLLTGCPNRNKVGKDWLWDFMPTCQSQVRPEHP